MFAKLKKKIETEAGPVGDSPGKGLSRHSSISSLPGAGSFPRPRDGPSPPGSVTSEDSSMRDVTSSRDELMQLLQKRTEQCRKMEGNVSDLAALVKEKNKTIEKLEASLKQQDEITNQKLQDQKAEFEKYRDKLVEGYQEERLKLDQEKQELLKKLSKAEEYRAKYFKREEETDEFEGYTTQELAKVKHLLLNTEESLNKTQALLDAKTRQCQAAESQVESLTDQLGPAKQRLTELEAENASLKEETRERAELVTTLTKEKSVFDKRLDEINNELTEKQGQISQLQNKLSDLEGDYNTLQRNSDIQRNKTGKLLQEKDEHIDMLNERVQTLEQRISDSSLSGDERTSAIQAERNAMEEKLSEARQQLTEVKTTWSDKITQLEEQISHLNAKIIEDSEEMAAQQKNSEHMRETFHKQVEDLQFKLEDAEKRALENLELVSTKDKHYEKRLHEMECERAQHHLAAVDRETQLRSKIASLESEMNDLERARTLEKEETRARIAQFEVRESQFTDRELKLETELKTLEEKVKHLETKLKDSEDQVSLLQEQLKASGSTESDHNTQIASLKSKISEMERAVEKAEKDRATFEKHLRTSEEEKGGLLERNANLHMQIQALKTSNTESRMELERTVELKSKTIANMEKTEAGLREKLEAMERQMEASAISKAESGLYSQRLEDMTAALASLQEQLNEKTKTVKKQEQTLKDLRVTLQRELKVQSLPNDEQSDTTYNNMGSPNPGRKHDGRSDSSNGGFTRSSSSGQSQYSYHPGQQNMYGSQQQPTAAVLPVQTSNVTTLTSMSPSVPSGAKDALTAHTMAIKRDLDKDVNFLYLKHVVLKFMLSREAEAIQLIKAVSMLLNFTHQEQQLIKETLEWKMSWFGSRPPLGKGQKSKVIPPTL